MSTNYTGGLNFTWPTKGDVNWDGNVDASLTRISAHDHSGGGNGVQFTSSAFAANAIPGTKIRLANAEYLRGRNAGNTADVNLVRVTSGDQPEYQGTATNDAATAGAIGEMKGPITKVRSAPTSIPASTNVVNVCTTTSITLTPGDWDVRGAVVFVPGATTNITDLRVAVSKTSATLPGTDTTAVPTAGEYTDRKASAAYVPGNDITVPIPSFRVSVSVNTPLFLVASATFTVSTVGVAGSLEARRVR